MNSKTTTLGGRFTALGKNQVAMALVLSLLLFGLNVLINPKSFNPNAFGTILSLTFMLTIAAAGQTLVVISDGIDMSVGSIMSMTALITVSTMRSREDVQYFFITFLLSIVMGALVGFINGVGAVKIGLPPMIVTLCVSNVVTRLQYVFTNGKPTGTAAKWFSATVNHRMFGIIPTSIFYALLVFAIVFYMLNRSNFGQHLFLSGNNERAAFLTGIKTVRVKMFNYTLAGLLSGIAGWVGAGYMNFVMCQAFDNYTMTSIVSVVVGGTLLVGGKGSYIGTAAGALLMVVLSNFLAVLDLPQALRDLITGIVLIVLLVAYNREKPVRQ